MTLQLPDLRDVAEARRVLGPVAVRTPVLTSEALDRLTGGRIFLKCETLQRTGAFKFRGAYNCLSRHDSAAYPDGVVAYSTGNHGLAVSRVGQMLDIAVRIVMPRDAPTVKVARARAFGAELILYDRHSQTREEIAARIATRARVAVVPPGDNPHIVAGQATVVAEALEDIGAERVDAVWVPCGGGGLAAGSCLAVQAAGSSAAVWGVEPEGFDDTRRSLASGRRETNPALNGSICDALLAPTPAELPFAINGPHLAGAVSVSDAQVLAAIRFAFDELRLVVEPGGAIALARALACPEDFRDRTSLIVLSGGNIDKALFEAAMRTDPDSKCEILQPILL